MLWCVVVFVCVDEERATDSVEDAVHGGQCHIHVPPFCHVVVCHAGKPTAGTCCGVCCRKVCGRSCGVRVHTVDQVDSIANLQKMKIVIEVKSECFIIEFLRAIR